MAEETGTTPELGSSTVAVDAAEVAVESPRPMSEPMSEPAKPDAGGFVWGTGRRKAAVARVRVRPGKGNYLINGKRVDVYFTELRDQNDAHAPLKVTQTEGKLDVYVRTHGGGYMGQAGAVMLGLARALKGYDPSLEPMLRNAELLTRDPRRVERKKYGQRGARRRFQFSKR